MSTLKSWVIEHPHDWAVVENEQQRKINPGVIEVNSALRGSLMADRCGENEKKAVVYWQEDATTGDLRDECPEGGTSRALARTLWICNVSR